MDWEGALLRQRKGATIAKAFVDLEGSTAPISHINENIQDAQQDDLASIALRIAA
jgi:hypothetical protein